MDIYIYSDESGVFDKFHNDYFVFGGLVFLSKDDKDSKTRMYLSAENVVRNKENLSKNVEIKASTISNASKAKLFKSVNQIEKFGIVIRQFYLLDAIFESKKTKQRYMDWAYKMAVRHKFEVLINKNIIIPDEVKRLHFYVDEHTTATDGIYELKESLEQEFKIGTFDWRYNTFHPPLFKHLAEVNVTYCDSKTKPLVRAADIVANKLYHMAVIGDYRSAAGRNFDIASHPPLRTVVIE